MATVELRGIDKRFPDGTRALSGLDLQVGDGELMVIVGPSGCGKSTALRIVAGLEGPSSGEVLIDGAVVNALTPQQRNIAMVFQNYALYPHMTVRRNIEFPLRMMRLGRAERARRVARAAELLGLTDLLERRPKSLSGGQRQRVAMGRAIVRDPRVFLMDEPLSNLDARLRVEIRAEIAALQRRMGVTTIYVTHDQVEAMTLGDRVAVLSEGRLQQVAAPRDLYERPANCFVAGFIGSPPMNLFAARLARTAQGLAVVLGDQRIRLGPEVAARHPGLEAWLDRPIAAGLRPEAFALAEGGPDGERLRVVVEGSEHLGHETLVYFRLASERPGGPAGDAAAPAGHIARLARPPGGLRPGAPLTLAVDHDRVHLFGAQKNGDGGAAI